MQNDFSDGMHVDYQGNKTWYLNGVLHREDGPAVEWVNGYKSWWLHGQRVTKAKVNFTGLKGLRMCIRCFDKTSGTKTWVKIPERYCIGCLKEMDKVKTKEQENIKINMEKVSQFLSKEKKKHLKELAADIMLSVAVRKVGRQKLFLL